MSTFITTMVQQKSTQMTGEITPRMGITIHDLKNRTASSLSLKLWMSGLGGGSTADAAVSLSSKSAVLYWQPMGACITVIVAAKACWQALLLHEATTGPAFGKIHFRYFWATSVPSSDHGAKRTQSRHECKWCNSFLETWHMSATWADTRVTMS